MEEQDILDALKSEQNKAYESLYDSYFGKVSRFICHNNGNARDAEDVFQDAMMVLVQKIRNDHFRLTASMGTYIMAISKNIWLNRLRNSKRQEEKSDKYFKTVFMEVDEAIDQERFYKSQLQKYIYKVSKHCQAVIDDVFFKGKTTEQIQNDYGYSSKQNAANQQYKCVEQLRRQHRKK
ncbi:MAG: sigma-70 family RNA polymerase sigma factor [Bacteroidota bacterium]